MSTVSPSTTNCPRCNSPLGVGRQPCPHCQAPADWLEGMEALDFAQRRFEQWAQNNTLYSSEARHIDDAYRRRKADLIQALEKGDPRAGAPDLSPYDHCWSCGAACSPVQPYCESCGAPWQSPAARSLRFLTFLGHEIKRHEESGDLSLTHAHECLSQTKERLAALRKRLEKERLATATPVVTAEVVEPAAPRKPAVSQRPLAEIILDPKNIQWLLIFGAAMIVTGLVIYLWVEKFFEDPIHVAVLLGIATLGLLAGGWSVIRLTRYQVAGRALTLLACLIMPLNLWFYHAQALHPLTLYEQLWVAALACCALYTASALILRDPVFVYVLAAGVTMTGLLLLADVDGKDTFWQITHPATLLVVLGLLAIHAERAFVPAEEGAFTRKRFGLAFFWSGHALLGAGLLLVLAAQLIGYFFKVNAALFAGSDLITGPSPLTTERTLQLLALLLVLAGTYAYVYSDLVVRRIGVYIYLAVFTLLWAEVLVVNLLTLEITQELAIIVMALTALVANLAQLMVTRPPEGGAATEPTGAKGVLLKPLARAGQPIALFLATLPVLMGIGLLWRALHGTYTIYAIYVGAMVATALSCRVGAHLYRHTLPKLSAMYFFGTAAATLLAAAGLLNVFDLTTWEQQVPLLMVLPIVYLIASRLYRGHTAEQPLVWVSHAATGVLLAASLTAAFRGFSGSVRGDTLNLALAGFFAEATLFYALAAAFRRQSLNIYFATAMACGAVWQLLSYGQFDDVYYTLTFALVGLALLIAYRFAVLETINFRGLAEPAFQCGNALLSLGFTAGVLLTLSHLAAGQKETKGALEGMLLSLVAISLVAAALVRHQGWRRWYIVTTITQAVLSVLVLAIFGNLTLGEKVEIASVVIGLALLVLGHVGWAREREQDRQSDVVSLSLFLGSLMVALPLTIATLTHRSHDEFHWPDEIGLLAAGMLFLATGFMLQLRSTTLTGAAAVVVYVATLPIYLPWSKVSVAAICLMAGGGVIFGTGLLLSIYRDRLLTLPDRIQRREGVFRVLSWR